MCAHVLLNLLNELGKSDTGLTLMHKILRFGAFSIITTPKKLISASAIPKKLEIS